MHHKHPGVHIMDLKNLIALAKEKIGLGQSIDSISETLNKIADGNDPGDTAVFGGPTSQDYNSMVETGTKGFAPDNNDPDEGDTGRFGPIDADDDLKRQASSNKPCKDCGAPSDSCQCKSINETNYGSNNQPLSNTKHKIKNSNEGNPRMDPTVSQAAQKALIEKIVHLGQLIKKASHFEEIEIPFSDLHMEKGVDYNMSGRTQEVTGLVTRYLGAHVYTGPHKRFTIVRIEQTKDKLFVTVMVFDNQLDHVEASTVTNGDKLHKVSNIENEKITKTAWRKRLTVAIGSNDETGLVQCPIEGMYLTRACGTCPLAGNPETYVQDGYVECHFDDMTSWLGQGINAHEHVPYQR
jgi:hypothetical protein